MQNNKVGTYLLYAIGEIFLVVAGILIAVEIDDLKQVRDDEKERIALLKEMQNDFQANQSRINSNLKDYEAYIRKTNLFLTYSHNSDTISIDSLKLWASGAFEHSPFLPILTTYDQAISSGKIGLIKDRNLLEQIAEFNRFYQDYQLHTQLSGENYYFGATADLRKIFPELHALGTFENGDPQRKAFEISEEEYRKLIKDPLVFIAIESAETLYKNFPRDLINMKEVNNKILVKLNQFIE
jgi:hypothetical protein